MFKHKLTTRRVLVIAIVSIFVLVTMLCMVAVAESNVDNKFITLEDQMANPSITYELVFALAPYENRYMYYNYSSTGTTTHVPNLYYELLAGPYGPESVYSEGIQQGYTWSFTFGLAGKKSWIKSTLDATVSGSITYTANTVSSKSFSTPAPANSNPEATYYIYKTYAKHTTPYTTWRYAYLQKPTGYKYSTFPYVQIIGVTGYTTSRYTQGDIAKNTSYSIQETYGAMWHLL